ncbi:hypothetical protein ACIB24_20000 [Spongisporangium articulatum]|uniref:Glycosyl transferase family 4 n=1 Tax=Spongisporangium articulatum TaxID=3362603 RepID=A0ABW8AUQ9_9ACTN
MARLRRALGGAVAGGVAYAASRAAFRALTANPPGGVAHWERTNHAGEPITLLEGPAYAAGAAAAVAVAPGVPAGLRVAGVLATAGAGAFGAVDDLLETGKHKGLRGHLGELARGRLSTGGLKVLGIGATGLVAGVLALPPRPDDESPLRAGRLADAVVAGGVVAGAANLANLLDLRPGRVLKLVLLAAPAATSPAGGALVGAAAGAAAGLIGEDLAARAMLGDTGANAAGALLGTAAVHRLGRPGRLAALAGLVGLTLASEKVSFTKVIEATPGLREFDRLGR